jgi:MOB kinase activator 1
MEKKPMQATGNKMPPSAFAGIDKTKSFKQKKKISKGTRGYGLKQIARMTLGSGDMQLAVELPAGEDLNEWLAVNTIEFYNEINVLYGILTEFCTAESCATMSAGPKYEYLWADGHNVKTPLKVSAAEYIDFLMTWVESQLNNEKVFPC